MVRGVEIPKNNGKTRLLGIPTIEDRVAQMAVRRRLEPLVEPMFLSDSYGYRPNKSAIDAVGAARERCLKMPRVIEFGIKGLFDHINHEKFESGYEAYTGEMNIAIYWAISESCYDTSEWRKGRTKRRNTTGCCHKYSKLLNQQFNDMT